MLIGQHERDDPRECATNERLAGLPEAIISTIENAE